MFFYIRNNLFTYNWYISFCREKRAGKIVSMFPPKYLPFSSYIISPFLIIFSLSLPYYLSPFLSFPTSIISLFSFHPLIIYLPSSHFLLSPTIPERSPSLSSQIYELVCRYLLSYKPGFCVYVNGPCEIVLTIIKDQVRLLKQNKNIPWVRFFRKCSFI